MQFGLLQNFVSLDVPGHSESSESHVTKLLLEMHFLRLVSRPTPQELEQELHAPHVVHSEGEWGSRKLKGGIKNRRKLIWGFWDWDFMCFRTWPTFCFYSCVCSFHKYFYFLSQSGIQSFVRFYISFPPAAQKLPPPFLFISWSIQPLWAGTLLYTPGRFSWRWSWTGVFNCSYTHPNGFWKILG